MCTAVRFTDEKGNLIAGRNLDWGCGYGQKPVVVGKNFTWSSRHEGDFTTHAKIVGMGIVVPQLPNMPLFFDAASENGIYCAGLSFAAGYAQYNDPAKGKTNITSFEMPLWITTNFKTVAEVKRAVQNLNITNDEAAPGLEPTALHWFVADKESAIVIEQTSFGGGMDGTEPILHIYDDPFDVLTNQPDFSFHKNNMHQYIHLSSEWCPPVKMREATVGALGVGPQMAGLPGDPSAISRFVRVALLNAQYPEQTGIADNDTRLLKTLSSVAMVKGYCKQESGDYEYTLYGAGYNDTQKAYFYNTYDEPAVQTVSLADYENLEGLKVLG